MLNLDPFYARKSYPSYKEYSVCDVLDALNFPRKELPPLLPLSLNKSSCRRHTMKYAVLLAKSCSGEERPQGRS